MSKNKINTDKVIDMTWELRIHTVALDYMATYEYVDSPSKFDPLIENMNTWK